jgi:hypothetical protein
MSRNNVRRKPRQYVTEEERKALNEVAEEERNVLNEFALKVAAPPSPSTLREPARKYKNIIMDTRDINGVCVDTVLNESLQGPKSSQHGGGETDVQEYPPRNRMSDTTRLWGDCSYLPPFRTPHFPNSAGQEEGNFPNSAGEVGDFLSPLGKNFKNFPAHFEMHPVGSPRRGIAKALRQQAGAYYPPSLSGPDAAQILEAIELAIKRPPSIKSAPLAAAISTTPPVTPSREEHGCGEEGVGDTWMQELSELQVVKTSFCSFSPCASLYTSQQSEAAGRTGPPTRLSGKEETRNKGRLSLDQPRSFEAKSGRGSMPVGEIPGVIHGLRQYTCMGVWWGE